MYQVNYKWLRRRDTYDEIVAILEHAPTILKYPDRVQQGYKRKYPRIMDQFNARVEYPDRVATQIMNSPYMKQIDGGTLMEVQKQQDRLSKEQMKQLMIKAVAEATGKPFAHLQYVLHRDKMGEITGGAKSMLGDVGKSDDDAE